MKSEISKPTRKLSAQQQVIKKLVVANPDDKHFWPREMKMANKLVKEYGHEFMLWLHPPYGKPVSSLAYFLCPDGKNYISQQRFNFRKESLDLSPKIQSFPLSEDKIGEDVILEKKPKSLKDFLNLFVK